MPDLLYYALLAPPILLALTIHEYAHALVAFRLGDDTAARAGRLTLNPLAHLDILGTIMLFIIQLGWAKPVPVNPLNFANPRRGMLLVAAAGPVSNLLQAAVFGILYRLFGDTFGTGNIVGYGIFMLRFAVIINLILAFFNLLPIPPLDGSKILFSFATAVVGSYDRRTDTLWTVHSSWHHCGGKSTGGAGHLACHRAAGPVSCSPVGEHYNLIMP